VQTVKIGSNTVVGFQVLSVMSMKTAVFWDTVLCSLVMTDVSEELTAAFIRVKSYHYDIGSKFF
jgi:hypothetical protein